MTRTRTLAAYDHETSEPLGAMVFQVNFYGHPHCPKCGEVMEYEVGVIDQDYQGNNIRGFWHTCYDCGIETETMEGDGGYDE